ncbi:PAS domain-containing protein [Limnothrix redekei]|uniref:histidine kinase n=1 Tax=Limnothrix redekei LRLZ20PSL1 TaxID=3112953 RepID=A0ABW7C772_9CYAN
MALSETFLDRPDMGHSVERSREQRATETGNLAQRVMERLARGDRWPRIAQAALHDLRLQLGVDAVLIAQRIQNQGLQVVYESSRPDEDSRLGGEFPLQFPLLPITALEPVIGVAGPLQGRSPLLWQHLKALQIQCFVAIPIAPQQRHWGWLMAVQSAPVPPLSIAAQRELQAVALSLAVGLRLEGLEQAAETQAVVEVPEPGLSESARSNGSGGAIEPNCIQSGSAKPESSKPESSKPEFSKPEFSKPGSSKLGFDRPWHRSHLPTLAATDRALIYRNPDRDRVSQSIAQALRLAESRWMAVFRLNPSPGLILNGAGLILEANEAFTRLAGYLPAEVQGLSVQSLQGFLRDRDYQQIRSTIQTGRYYQSPELAIHDLNGQRKLVQLSAAPIELDGQACLFLAFQDISDLQRREAMLRALVEATTSIGKAFFENCVRLLAESLGVRYAFLTSVMDYRCNQAEVLAWWNQTEWGTSFAYYWTHHPCAIVFGGQTYTCGQNLQSQFPQGTNLRNLGAESYAGVPLQDSQGTTIGALIVMDTQPLPEDPNHITILRIFAARAAAELERQRANRAIDRLNTELAARAAEQSTDLAHSQHMLQKMADANPNMVYLYDLTQHRTLYINHAVQDILGYTPREIQAMTSAMVVRLVHPDDFERLAHHYGTVLGCADGEICEREYRMQRSDGEWRWLFERLTIFSRDRQGNPTQLLGNIADITPLKAVEGALRQLNEQLEQRVQERTAQLAESQRFVQQLADSTPNLLYLYNLLDQELVYVNQAVETLLGYSVPEIQRMAQGSFVDVLHPDDWLALLQYGRTCARTEVGQVLEREYRMRHANGEWRTLSSRETVFSLDEQGRPQLLLGTANDITDLKRLLEVLQRRSHRDRVLASLSQQFLNEEIGVALATTLSTVVSALHLSHAWFCSRPAAGQPWSLDGYWLRPTDQVACPLTPDPSTLLLPLNWLGDRLDRSEPILLPDPTDRSNSLNAAIDHWLAEQGMSSIGVLPIHYRSELVACFVLAMNQPAAWEPSSIKWAQQVGTLMAMAQSRATAEAALRQAKEAADLANRAKSEFLANLSHEIRTPMNSILGFCELLQREARDPKTRSWLQVMTQSGETLLALINDLLDLSKIEAGKLVLHWGPIRPRLVLREVAEMFTVAAQQKGIQVQVAVADRIPELITFDSVRLRQILVNLVGNAVKFTERGHVTISLQTIPSHAVPQAANNPDRATPPHQSPMHPTFVNPNFTGQPNPEALPEPTLNLRLTVTDTGIGIAPDQQARIFEAFIQSEGQCEREYGGTGLGLAIVKRLTAMLGGTIQVRSTLGQGSQFCLYFPAVPVVPTPIAGRSNPHPIAPDQPHPNGLETLAAWKGLENFEDWMPQSSWKSEPKFAPELEPNLAMGSMGDRALAFKALDFGLAPELAPESPSKSPSKSPSELPVKPPTEWPPNSPSPTQPPISAIAPISSGTGRPSSLDVALKAALQQAAEQPPPPLAPTDLAAQSRAIAPMQPTDAAPNPLMVRSWLLVYEGSLRQTMTLRQMRSFVEQLAQWSAASGTEPWVTWASQGQEALDRLNTAQILNVLDGLRTFADQQNPLTSDPADNCPTSAIGNPIGNTYPKPN